MNLPLTNLIEGGGELVVHDLEVLPAAVDDPSRRRRVKEGHRRPEDRRRQPVVDPPRRPDVAQREAHSETLSLSPVALTTVSCWPTGR